jgi:hypothetical protein
MIHWRTLINMVMNLRFSNPVEEVPRTAFLISRSDGETKHSNLSSVVVNNNWSCTSSPTYALMVFCLRKDTTLFLASVLLFTGTYIFLYIYMLFSCTEYHYLQVVSAMESQIITGYLPIINSCIHFSTT